MHDQGDKRLEGSAAGRVRFNEQGKCSLNVTRPLRLRLRAHFMADTLGHGVRQCMAVIERRKSKRLLLVSDHAMTKAVLHVAVRFRRAECRARQSKARAIIANIKCKREPGMGHIGLIETIRFARQGCTARVVY